MNFHDAKLVSIELRPERAVRLGILDEAGTLSHIVLAEVDRLQATDFREGNIILDISLFTRTMPPLHLLRSLFGLKQEGENPPYLKDRIDRVKSGELTLFYIAPSYGCEFAALCASVQVEAA
jgi:hypothetical protein